MPNDKLRFPILQGGGETIPWSLAQQAYRNYGSSQTLERVAERGGFGWVELDALLRDKYMGSLSHFEKDISVARERVLSHDKSLLAERDQLSERLKKLEEDLTRLQSAYQASEKLNGWAKHDDDCECDSPSEKCTCGMVEALVKRTDAVVHLAAFRF